MKGKLKPKRGKNMLRARGGIEQGEGIGEVVSLL